jgi:arylsulfatase A-like enzyme
MRFPAAIPAGARRQEPVSIRDIPATVTDVLGLALEEGFPGVSLARYANGRASAEERQQPRLAHLEPNNLFGAELEWANKEQHRLSIVSGKLHYLLDRGGTEELYDYVSDPWESTNLVKQTAMADSLQHFRAMVDSIDRRTSKARRR